MDSTYATRVADRRVRLCEWRKRARARKSVCEKGEHIA
jgi:hypothetical protein